MCLQWQQRARIARATALTAPRLDHCVGGRLDAWAAGGSGSGSTVPGMAQGTVSEGLAVHITIFYVINIFRVTGATGSRYCIANSEGLVI